MKHIWLILCLAIGLKLAIAAAAVADDATGVYYGRLYLTSVADHGHGSPRQSWMYKWNVHYRDGIRELREPFVSETPLEEERTEGTEAPTFSYSYFYDNRRGSECLSEVTVVFTPLSPKKGFVHLTFSNTCDDDSTLSGVYEGTINRAPLAADINVRGDDGVINHSSGCFRIPKPTTFDWDFFDDEGFFAQFSVVSQDCKTGRKSRLVFIRKITTDSVYREGFIRIRSPGRYRFIVNSTGSYEVDKRF